MDGAVTEFFSLEDSPAQPSANAEDTGLRDHYGFAVPSDYHELYRLYSPIWEKEETEREAHWSYYLSDLAHHTSDGGKFVSLEDLCSACLQDGVTMARDEKGPPWPQRQKLDALVHGGVPFTIRGIVWTIFLDTAVRKQRDYYNDLVKRCLGDLQYRGSLELDEIRQQAAQASAALQDAAALHGLSGYAAVTENALETWRANSKVWLTQIEKDLPRTFPGLQLMEVSGRPALRRVLAAYSLHNSRVGYCQGLNFVVGTLLLFLNEEDCFWCLSALLQDILKGYYDVDMMAMQVDQRVFKRLVSEHFPQLAAQLEGLGADVSCVFVQWFLCVFVNFLPIEACLRVWDALFYYRSPTVLFKTALALLEVFSPALSQCGDVLDALDLLQSLAPLTYDSDRLMQAALGPRFEGVSDARLDTLRQEYRQEVEAEAAALAEELAWEASSGGAGGGSASAGGPHPQGPHHPQHTQQQQQQPPSKISVLKMLARGMKEKFTGGGGGGGSSTATAAALAAATAAFAGVGSGSGRNSVERSASPAAPDPANPAAASVLLLNTTSSVALGGSAGAAGAAAAAVNGGGAEEPLLVRSSQALADGAAAAAGDVDSEDYHPLAGEEAFTFEQVGYVAPSEHSESNNAAVVLVTLPGEEDPAGGGGGGGAFGSAVVSAASASAGGGADFTDLHQVPPLQLHPAAAAAAGGLGGGGEGSAQTPSRAAAAATAAADVDGDPLASLVLPASSSNGSGVPATSPAAADSGGNRRTQSSLGGHTGRTAPASLLYMWHDTPKWTSMRASNAFGGTAAAGAINGFAASGEVTSTAASAPAALSAAAATPGGGGAAGSETPIGPLSPQVLMLAGSQSLMACLPSEVIGLDDSDAAADGEDGADVLHPLRLSFHGGIAPLIPVPLQDDVTALELVQQHGGSRWRY